MMTRSTAYTVKIFSHLLVFFLLVQANQAFARHHVLYADSDLPVSQKEAVIVLSGFGSVLHSFKGQKEALKGTPYDVFVPDYISRKSVDQSVEKLAEFLDEYPIEQYQKVHILAYIYGSWTINLLLQEREIRNLTSIVYDRSPLQEQVPYLLHEDKPLLGWVLFGHSLADLAQTPFQDIQIQPAVTGLMIEARPTKIARVYDDEMTISEDMWKAKSFSKHARDHCYVDMNHDDMYTDLKKVIDQVFDFFENGKFGADVNRIEPKNPFE